MPKVVEEFISIDQNTPNVVVTLGVANIDSEIITYPLPTGAEFIIMPNDFFAIDLTAGVLDSDMVTLLVSDAWNRRSRILASGQFIQFQEFQSSLLKYYMRGTIKVDPNFYLRVRVLSATPCAIVDTLFCLTGKLVYETLD